MLQSDKQKDYYNNGVSDFIEKNYASSIENFTQAMEQGNHSYQVWISRGAAYLQANKIKRALKDLNYAVSLRPNNARAYHMRALAYDKKGDLDAALDDLKHAINIDPEYGAAFRSRAMILDKIGRSDDAAEDMQMATHLTEKRLAEFNYENNVWQSQHLRMESEGIVSEMER